MSIYVPGTQEKDLSKVIMSLQQVGGSAVVGPGSATDGAAARFDTTTGKLIKDSALIIDDTTGALSRSGGGGIAIQGTNTNTAAATGFVGERLSSTVTIASAFALTSGSGGQVWNTLSLTAGAWLVGGNAGVIHGTPTGAVFTHMHCDHNAVGATTIQTSPGGGTTTALHVTSNDPNGWIFQMGQTVYNLSATTTINAVMTADFTGGPAGAYGVLWGIRLY